MFKSKQQAKLFFAADEKPGGVDGLSHDTAKKFIKDTKHQKISKLPKYIDNDDLPKTNQHFMKLKAKLRKTGSSEE